MIFDFDKASSRRGTNSYKWDSAQSEDLLPMWVADMDFPTAPAIVDALQQRVAHGIFGYTRVPGSYYEAVKGWFSRRHHWDIDPQWIIYTSGVVPAISAIIKATTVPGDKVLVQTPVYNCFFSSIRNNGCDIVSSPLLRTGHTYRMDFDDLERKVADDKVKVMLLCNPHNPVGRVWTREELQRVGDICLRHGVLVVSDEIHGELSFPGHPYLPFASLSQRFQQHSVTCVSPSKAFNMAGLQIANIVCADADLRKRIDKAININEVCDVNPFGVIATETAYNECEEWLQQLLAYLYDNYLYMQDFCRKYLSDFSITKLEGTYLVWMDCSALHLASADIEERLKAEAHLWLNSGTMYGAEGEGFMRWNIACPRSRLIEGLKRFQEFTSGASMDRSSRKL